MKSLQTKLLTAIFSLFLFVTYAQDSKNQMFWVHEDVVNPSKVIQYEESAKQLVENMNKFNIQGTSWICANTADMRYLYITPISKMADLDENILAPLFEKMGEEANKMFEKMNACYDRHTDYVLNLIPSLSYQPGGIDQTPEGQNYRKFFYVYTTPGKTGGLWEAFKGIKELFESKGSKQYYRVYTGGFGAPENFMMVAVAGEDAVSFETASAENDKLLGDERWDVFGKLMENALRFEEYSGQMRPDLAYSPKKD